MARSRLLSIALAVAVAGVLAGAPAAGASELQAPGCDVRDAVLTWGFKESFRAYIDGGIANGEWTTEGGATYETPVFSWSGGTGRFNSDTGNGFVQFEGSVRFTGHGGVLDTVIADPALALSGGTGTLILDVSGATMDGGRTDAQDVRFVELGDIEVSGEDALVTVDATAVLTPEGEDAFPEYQAGAQFDPVAFELPTSGDCAAGFDGGDAGPAAAPIDPVLVGFVVGVPLLLIVVVVAVVLRRRRPRA